MILAFNYVLVLQAMPTTFDAELQERGVMDRTNIKGKTFYVLKEVLLGKDLKEWEPSYLS